ncbi:acyl-ACP--UDP-N-acetylglucosamine O-acyltransferase [Aliiroseovarius sp. S1339]|uniref:acyl-ACP--UDP-N-acetylglucosamine O-acyltransferase n=1 Tax=Aliiroseovarius sp. S1339 TaxID=2936990 RepID=UPI0020BE71A6|nr:acyl-ACP--UDP-N-acetylglucosamine O-acyltransferase [Aliiroseovarius sp. S1339]MCK8463543.1 acyl-ACP--UDP-N-acetylglucosamine O-acyltransferase [Aliiroseovarius sp. S1339]
MTANGGVDPTAQVHASAIVDDGATIGRDCRVGPFCVIGPQVKLGAGVEVKSHVVITGDTEIGDHTVIFPFSVIGEIPQDLKFAGEDTKLVIGKRNRIREHVTMNTGTAGGGYVTRIGDDGLFMAGCHVAHDAQIGNNVILVNNVAVAGHVVIEDDVIVGGLSGLHQWIRIGRGAIIGALSMVTADVLPFALVQGPRAELDGLNLVGLKRRGVARADISALRAALKVLKDGDGSFRDRAAGLAGGADSQYVRELVTFITGDSDRGFLTPK